MSNRVKTYALPQAGRPYAHPTDATVACLKAIEVAEGAGKGGAK